METRQRRSFTADYKRQAVDLVASSGRSIGSVAKALGLRESVLRRWVELRGAGSVPTAADSFSIDCIRDSASSMRPCDSSQRGDSGRFLRKYQTISEPTPAMMNIGRHPQAGMIR